MARPSSSKPQPLHSRDALLRAATTLFSRVGFDGATVRDIADAAGVNLSLVSYYFKNKEGLYIACIEQFGRERLAAARKLLQPARSVDEFRVRYRMLVEEILRVQVDQREIMTIVMKEVDAGLPIAREAFKETFLEIFTAFQAFFKSAQKAGIVRKDLDSLLIANFLHTGITGLIRCDAIAKTHFDCTLTDTKHFGSVVETIIQVSLGGVLAKPEGK